MGKEGMNGQKFKMNSKKNSMAVVSDSGELEETPNSSSANLKERRGS